MPDQSATQEQALGRMTKKDLEKACAAFVREAIAEGVELDEMGVIKRPAFDSAGFQALLEPLKERGLLDKPMFESDTALSFAATCVNLDAVKAALDAGADPKAPTRWRQSALMQALHGMHQKKISWAQAQPCMELLLDSGVDLHHRNEVGQQAITWASWESKDLSPARWLLSKGADPNAADAHGATALHHAAQTGELEMAKLFLGAGADPWVVAKEAGGKKKVDPLGLAIEWARVHGNLGVITLLAGAQKAGLERKALEKAVRKRKATAPARLNKL